MCFVTLGAHIASLVYTVTKKKKSDCTIFARLLVCPITRDLPVNLVVAEDGHVYFFWVESTVFPCSGSTNPIASLQLLSKPDLCKRQEKKRRNFVFFTAIFGHEMQSAGVRYNLKERDSGEKSTKACLGKKMRPCVKVPDAPRRPSVYAIRKSGNVRRFCLDADSPRSPLSRLAPASPSLTTSCGESSETPEATRCCPQTMSYSAPRQHLLPNV